MPTHVFILFLPLLAPCGRSLATERIPMPRAPQRAQGINASAMIANHVTGLPISTFDVGEGGPGARVDVLCVAEGRYGRVSAGTVHHVAWRVANDQSQRAWRLG